ncbi:DNA adenine methylase [soil metagenome]
MKTVSSNTCIKEAHPFIKWAGGKNKMLRHLEPFIPETWGTYHEPFVGGGAMFFGLHPERAVLSDTNPELIHCYETVRDDVDGLIDELRKHHYDKGLFYAVRAQQPSTLTPAARAARFIYLNKTCFNGLHRVNRKGEFNVPFGAYKNPQICDEPNLRACSAALQGVTILLSPFEAVMTCAEPGDFVYFDPPYLPISATSSFTGYTADGFSARDHLVLRDVARELKARGVHVVISNSAPAGIVQLYADGFEIARVGASRSINAKGDRRGKVEELIIH